MDWSFSELIEIDDWSFSELIEIDDWSFSELIEIDDFGCLEDAPTETDVDELNEDVKGTSEGFRVADLVWLAQTGLEDEVFAAFPLLAESDQAEMSLACEYLQVDRFMQELQRSPRLCWKQKLNFFRLAQRIRGEHGITFENPPPELFQSFDDILELERDIEINNGVKFMIHCMRLDLVDGQYVGLMFRSASTVEQLAAIYDECVLTCRRNRRPGSSDKQYYFGLEFRFPFRDLIMARPCKRPLWRDIKIYLERAVFLDEYHMFASDYGTLKTNLDEVFSCLLSNSDLDEALSCLLSNAQLFKSDAYKDVLAHLTKSLLSRGASLYYRDQHGVSSLGRLLGLGDPHVEWPLETLSTYICCPWKKKRGKIIANKRRPAPLTCLAAWRIPPSTIEEQLPSLLRPFVRGHQELRGILKGSIRRPEPVDEWRLYRPYDENGRRRYSREHRFWGDDGCCCFYD